MTGLIKLLSLKGSCIAKLSGKQWGLFVKPAKIIRADALNEVEAHFKLVEKKVQSAFYCVIFLSFESSPSFDPALKVKKNKNIPLLWAAFFKKPFALLRYEDFPNSDEFSVKTKPEISEKEYESTLLKIKRYIEDGDTYQVNFTFRIAGRSEISSPELFLNLFKTQRPQYGAFINAGGFSVISMSPELFIQRISSKIISEPMKGTISRMPLYDDDQKQKKLLVLDIKNRAENLMITDMVRNDMGRICKYGTVKTTKLFDLITTPFVHQMISRVEGRLKNNISFFEIFKALFPAASVTGAPKVRTLQIIRALEKSPRGLYTGTIGAIGKNFNFIFNVAIRNALIKNNILSAGIGGGVVADSETADEWNEAKLKSSFLVSKNTSFDIFETILFEKNNGGCLWLNEHLDRLENSQKYFLRKFNREKIKKHLVRILQILPPLARIKISLDESGKIKSEWRELPSKGWGKEKVSIIISKKKTNSSNLMLYHKTTERKIYDAEFTNAQQSGYDEVIFTNEYGQITEGAISNVFVKIKNRWLTPPLKCGLLPGICRKYVILQLSAKEQVIYIKEFMIAKQVIICNSVRGAAEAAKIIF